MQADPNYSVCSLADTFTNNVIINVLNMTSFCAKLILLILTLFTVRVCGGLVPVFVFFNLISQSVSLSHFCGLFLLLLDVLVHILLTRGPSASGCRGSCGRSSLWLSFSVCSAGINNSSCLSGLKVPILVLNVVGVPIVSSSRARRRTICTLIRSEILHCISETSPI